MFLREVTAILVAEGDPSTAIAKGGKPEEPHPRRQRADSECKQGTRDAIQQVNRHSSPESDNDSKKVVRYRLSTPVPEGGTQVEPRAFPVRILKMDRRAPPA